MAITEQAHPSARRDRRFLGLFAGGPDGNEQLTTITGAILLVLLAVIGISILRIRQLISVHLFVGLLVLGPVALKMASTGYRFVRYYASNPAYRSKGPPDLFMRLIAPVVVVSTVVVFASGIVLLADGPRGRGQWLPIHKVSFIVWAVFTGLHVVGHLPALSRAIRAERPGGLPSTGVAGRWLALGGGLVVGLLVAVVLLPQFGPWTAHRALAHRH